MPQTVPIAPPAKPRKEPAPAPRKPAHPPRKPAHPRPQRELDPFNPDWPKTRPTPEPKADRTR
jgi:hypothetical protein